MEGISLSSHGLNHNGLTTYIAHQHERVIRCGIDNYRYVFFAANDFDAYVHAVRYLKEHPDE